MYRVAARPEVATRLAARGGERQRARGHRLILKAEMLLQPGLDRRRFGARRAPACEQQLERRRPRAARLGKNPGHDQFAVHGLASFTVRTPLLPRWRAKI